MTHRTDITECTDQVAVCNRSTYKRTEIRTAAGSEHYCTHLLPGRIKTELCGPYMVSTTISQPKREKEKKRMVAKMSGAHSPQTPPTRKTTEDERDGNRVDKTSARYYCKCSRRTPRQDRLHCDNEEEEWRFKEVTQERKHVKEKSAFLRGRGEAGEASMSPSFSFPFPSCIERPAGTE